MTISFLPSFFFFLFPFLYFTTHDLHTFLWALLAIFLLTFLTTLYLRHISTIYDFLPFLLSHEARIVLAWSRRYIYFFFKLLLWTQVVCYICMEAFRRQLQRIANFTVSIYLWSEFESCLSGYKRPLSSKWLLSLSLLPTTIVLLLVSVWVQFSCISSAIVREHRHVVCKSLCWVSLCICIGFPCSFSLEELN